MNEGLNRERMHVIVKELEAIESFLEGGVGHRELLLHDKHELMAEWLLLKKQWEAQDGKFDQEPE